MSALSLPFAGVQRHGASSLRRFFSDDWTADGPQRHNMLFLLRRMQSFVENNEQRATCNL